MVLEEKQPPVSKERSVLRPSLIILTITIITMLIYAYLAGLHVVPGDSLAIIGVLVIMLSIIFLGAACLYIGRITSKMPEYGEMEDKFRTGIEHYEAEEWEEALGIFKELLGPKMDHKRALYYAARCCEKLDRWDDVKTYIKRYLELQPRDREAWELLAEAHKKFFEYEEAERALERAENLPPRGK